jgi:transketolase
MQDRNDLDTTCINTIRTLSMDAVQAANSGQVRLARRKA